MLMMTLLIDFQPSLCVFTVYSFVVHFSELSSLTLLLHSSSLNPEGAVGFLLAFAPTGLGSLLNLVSHISFSS